MPLLLRAHAFWLGVSLWLAAALRARARELLPQMYALWLRAGDRACEVPRHHVSDDCVYMSWAWSRCVRFMCVVSMFAPEGVCVLPQVVGNHLVQGAWPTDCACSEPEIEEITDGRQVETIDNSVLTFERTGDEVTVVTADGKKCQQVKDDVVAGLSVIHILDAVRTTMCLRAVSAMCLLRAMLALLHPW